MSKRTVKDTLYYETIPKKENVKQPKDDTDKVLLLLKSKYDMKLIRTEKVKELKEKKKEIYQLSVKINAMESEIDSLIMQRL